MNNKLLIILEAINNSESISEAGKKIFFSQSYISQVLKKVENEYKIKLVNRNNHPVNLTPAGKTTLHYLYKENQLHEKMQQVLGSFSNEPTSQLRLGIMPFYGNKFNLSILPKVLNNYPNLQIITYELSGNTAKQFFKSNKLDIYVGTPIHLANIRSKQLDHDKQVIVISKESRIYKKDKFIIYPSEKELAQLNKDSFIGIESQINFHSQVSQYLKSLSININEKIKVSDPLTALELVGKGLGDTVIGQETVTNFYKNNKNINIVDLPNSNFDIAFNLSYSFENEALMNEIKFTINTINRIFNDNIMQLSK